MTTYKKPKTRFTILYQGIETARLPSVDRYQQWMVHITFHTLKPRSLAETDRPRLIRDFSRLVSQDPEVLQVLIRLHVIGCSNMRQVIL